MLEIKQKRVFEYLTRYGLITMQDIQVYLTNYEARRFIKQLEREDLVERIAYGVWRLKRKTPKNSSLLSYYNNEGMTKMSQIYEVTQWKKQKNH